MACRPWLNWARTEYEVKRLRDANPDLLSPEQACAPRFESELSSLSPDAVVFAVGKMAFRGLFPHRSDSIQSICGSLVAEAGRKVVPVVGPHFVAVRGRWERMFRRSIKRGVQWGRDELDWQDPSIRGADPADPPTFKEIRNVLSRWRKIPGLVVGYDLETDGIEALRARIRCIQLSTPDEALVIPIRTKQGRDWTVLKPKKGKPIDVPPSQARYFPYFYRKREIKRIFKLLRAFFRNPGHVRLVGLNNWVYDDLVLEKEGERWIGQSMAPPVSDDLLARHRVIDSEARHALSYQGAFYTTVRDWKAGKGNGWDAATDHELYVYGARDSAVTARVEIAQRKMLSHPRGGGDAGPSVYQHDEEMARVCTGMKKLGYHVDQVERARLEAHYTAIADQALIDLGQALGEGGCSDLVESVGAGTYQMRWKGRGKRARPALNPLSSKQVQELWYDRWDLPPPRMSAGGKILTPFDPDTQDPIEWILQGMQANWLNDNGRPSTGDPVILAYLADHHNYGLLEPWQERAMLALRKYRKAKKLIGDKLVPARLLSPSDYDSDGYPIPMKANGKWPVTAVWADGVLRTGWKLGTGVGRLSSGDPYNLQNVTQALRTMFVPAPGHVFVGADFDQLHLKIIANIWNIPSLQEDFLNDRDPHATMAALAFGADWTAALAASGGNPKKGMAKRLRNWGKNIRYTGAYGGSPRVIHAIMQKASDEDWNLQNLDVKLEDVEHFYETWMANEPQWKAAWDRALRDFERKGYVEDGVMGRRCYFRDNNNLRTKVPNFEVIAEEAAVAGLATRELVRRIPYGSWSPQTGVVEQCHDALVAQVPIDRVEEAKVHVLESMNIRPANRNIMYTAGVDVGRRRADVA